MEATTESDLALAVAATRYGGGPKRLSRLVAHAGTDALRSIFAGLDSKTRESVEQEATSLAEHNTRTITLGSTAYPHGLMSLRTPPAILFCRGEIGLLSEPGIGICGSRKASDVGLRAASICGRTTAQLGMAAISGYARGVDTAAHVSALATGGATVIVLPEGIDNFRIKRGELAYNWDDNRTLIISQFAPSQPWQASNAMLRNATIIGLSLALVVVEAGETGGTLAAGQTALELGRRVLALEFSNTPRGNTSLLENGAVSVDNPTELVEFLDQLRTMTEELCSPPFSPENSAAPLF